MSQYRVGTVTVTNASTAVVGVGTKFLTEVTVGDLFIRVGDNVTYEVASITDDLNLVLNANYSGVTGAGVLYTINRDFTTGNIPYFLQGDIETATVFKRAMLRIQDLISPAPIPITLIQDAEAGLIVYDGMTLDRDLSIAKVGIYAAIPPTGANINMKLLKDGSEVNDAIVLTAAANNEKTTLGTPESFITGDRIGLKFTQAGSGTPGGEIIVTLYPL